MVFAIATLTYLLTIGPSASLWDCAEFIACDYKLEIGHPPGAPFYMLVYNVISHLGGSPEPKLARPCPKVITSPTGS